MGAYVLKLLYFLFAIVTTTRSRKYDIEYEALKLYGRNVSGILDRFRRSSDYVKILNDKVQELNLEFSDIYFQTSNYCAKNLKKKIADMLGVNITTLSTPTTATSPATTTVSSAPGGRHGKREGVNETVTTQKKIERIDGYSKLTSLFTFKERIKFKDIGFKMAGDCIRLMRDSMNVDGETSGKQVNQAVSASEGNYMYKDKTTFKVYAKDEEKGKTANAGARINLWHSDRDKKNSTKTYKLYAHTRGA